MERINDSTKANASGCNSLHESRFKILLFIFQLGGHPLNLESVSRSNAVYNATILVCFYITTMCLFMDTFVNRHNLEEAMKKLRSLIGFIIVTWMHLSFR